MQGSVIMTGSTSFIFKNAGRRFACSGHGRTCLRFVRGRWRCTIWASGGRRGFCLRLGSRFLCFIIRWKGELWVEGHSLVRSRFVPSFLSTCRILFFLLGVCWAFWCFSCLSAGMCFTANPSSWLVDCARNDSIWYCWDSSSFILTRGRLPTFLGWITLRPFCPCRGWCTCWGDSKRSRCWGTACTVLEYWGFIGLRCFCPSLIHHIF